MSPTLESRTPSARPTPVDRRPLVLVIDPDVTARTVLEVALARDGFDVWSADHSEQGLELMAVERVPDVVVLESDLGGEDGFSLVAQLRGAARTQGVKVVLLARAGEPNVEAMAEVVGVDDVIQKPAFARDVSALVRLELARRDGAPMVFQAVTLPPAHLLRALLSSPRSGRMTLADGRGEVRFTHGRVTDVRFEGKGDLEALTRALAFTRGSYSVKLEAIAPTDELVCGLRELVQRVLPRLTRWAKALERSLPLDARLGVDFARLSSWLGGMPDEVNRIVQLFDGHRSVEDVVADSPFDETLTLQVATRLYLMGIVAPVQKARDEVVVLKRAPRLFEPRATEVEELMQQLFAGQAEIRGEEPGVGLSADDWFHAPEGTGLEVSEPDGGWQVTAPPELTQDLAPELKAQLDAFEIPIQVEPVETAPASRVVEQFAYAPQAAAEGPTASMEEVLRGATGDEQATLVGQRLDPVTPVAPGPVTQATQATQATPVGRLTLKQATPAPAVAPVQMTQATPALPTVVAAQVPPTPVAVAQGPAPRAEDTTLPELAAAPAGTGADVRARLDDPQERIVTPLLTPAVSASGTPAQERITTPILMQQVAPTPAAPVAAEAAFFNEEAFGDAADGDLELPVARRRPVWPFLALGLAALGLAVLFDALRAGPPPVEAPVVAFRGLKPPPVPVELPDIDEPVFFDDAPLAEEIPTVVDVSENLAEARRLYENGRYGAAKSLLEQVLTDDPKSVTAWTLLGLVKYDSMDVAGARAAADQVLAIDPENARVQVLLATLHFEAGDYPSGRQALHQYLRLEPEGPFAAEAKALLRR